MPRCGPTSCPGPTLISTAAFTALAATTGTSYASDMDCTVTLYDPVGWFVSLTFTSFSTEAGYDCTCCCVCVGLVPVTGVGGGCLSLAWGASDVGVGGCRWRVGWVPVAGVLGGCLSLAWG